MMSVRFVVDTERARANCFDDEKCETFHWIKSQEKIDALQKKRKDSGKLYTHESMYRRSITNEKSANKPTETNNREGE